MPVRLASPARGCSEHTHRRAAMGRFRSDLTQNRLSFWPNRRTERSADGAGWAIGTHAGSGGNPYAGGPSASRGPGYQTYSAIYQTLELIVRYYAAPHKAFSISMEPRIVHRESGSVTAWDIVIDADTIAWEAKLNVTKQELIEWLQ